jgi:hypothetical protein
MVRVVTPRPWPEGTVPTAEQFRDWFLACTPDEQMHLSSRILEDAGRAAACVMADHDQLLSQLAAQQATIRRVLLERLRYAAAWRSARRRGVWLLQRSLP